MTRAFEVDLLVLQPPADAQARAVVALADPARAIGLRLTRRHNGTLSYRPRVQFPFVVMLWHYLGGERMTVRFDPAEGGGTNVKVTGVVARGKHALACDPDFWTEALGGSERSAEAMLSTLYERFNARDVDAILPVLAPDVEWPNGWEGGYVRGCNAVRDYWTRQWREIDSTVLPEAYARRPDGRVDVTVRQVVKTPEGELVSDSIVHHVYRLEDGRVEHMEIA